MNEFELIHKIKTWIPRSLQGPLAIGDDAAILNPPAGEQLVFTTDAMIEGVDFHSSPSKINSLGFLSASAVGRKALAVNLSDLAAMGAKPLACVVTLGIPETMKESWLKEFYQGLIALAKEYRVLITGGDLTEAPEFFVSIALLGSAKKSEIVTRSGAKPGDWIGVTGALGGSILKKHAAFQPRVHEARFLTEKMKPTSMLDISDGFLQDLGHILESSKVGAELEMFEIPISHSAVKLAKGKPFQAFERACTDGEDFELLFTVSIQKRKLLQKLWAKHFPKSPLSFVGKITKGKNKIIWRQNGRTVPAPKFKSQGYQHFK